MCIPVLRLSRRRKKVLFYCHFPDQLLTQRASALKKLYRAPIDWMEERTTGMVDMVGSFRDTTLGPSGLWSLLVERLPRGKGLKDNFEILDLNPCVFCGKPFLKLLQDWGAAFSHCSPLQCNPRGIGTPSMYIL